MRSAIYLLVLLAGPASAVEPAYEWRYRSDDPDRAYLFRDGTQIGGWCYRTSYFRPLDGETWGRPTRISPVPPPMRDAMVARISWPSAPRPRGLRGRMGAALGQAVVQIAHAWTVQLIEEEVRKALQSLEEQQRRAREQGEIAPKSAIAPPKQ